MKEDYPDWHPVPDVDQAIAATAVGHVAEFKFLRVAFRAVRLASAAPRSVFLIVCARCQRVVRLRTADVHVTAWQHATWDCTAVDDKGVKYSAGITTTTAPDLYDRSKGKKAAGDE